MGFRKIETTFYPAFYLGSGGLLCTSLGLLLAHFRRCRSVSFLASRANPDGTSDLPLRSCGILPASVNGLPVIALDVGGVIRRAGRSCCSTALSGQSFSVKMAFVAIRQSILNLAMLHFSKPCL